MGNILDAFRPPPAPVGWKPQRETTHAAQSREEVPFEAAREVRWPNALRSLMMCARPKDAEKSIA